MSEPTKDASGVPLGEAPESVLRQRELTRALLSDVQSSKPKKNRPVARRPDPVVTESAEGDPVPEVEAEPLPSTPTVAPKFKRRPITLEHQLISFELEILDFSVTNRFLTVIFENSVKMPDPTEPTKFKLHIAGRTYPVEHMGINFDIPSLSLRGVSFLLSEDSQ